MTDVWCCGVKTDVVVLRLMLYDVVVLWILLYGVRWCNAVLWPIGIVVGSFCIKTLYLNKLGILCMWDMSWSYHWSVVRSKYHMLLH